MGPPFVYFWKKKKSKINSTNWFTKTQVLSGLNISQLFPEKKKKYVTLLTFGKTNSTLIYEKVKELVGCRICHVIRGGSEEPHCQVFTAEV